MESNKYSIKTFVNSNDDKINEWFQQNPPTKITIINVLRTGYVAKGYSGEETRDVVTIIYKT